jgi:UDP-glucose:glycoprotein glucosyltransferase
VLPHSSTIDWPVVQSQFDDFLAFESQNGNDAQTNLESLIGTEGSLVVDLNKTRGYAERLGVKLSHSPTGHAFVNGKYFEMDDVRRF